MKNATSVQLPVVRANLVILSEGREYVERVAGWLVECPLFNVEHVGSLNALLVLLREQSVDVVMADVSSDQAESLMLPCWVGELYTSGRLRKPPRILWTIRDGSLEDAMSLFAGIEYSKMDTIGGVSATALASHASLARASGVWLEMAPDNHLPQLLRVLERLATSDDPRSFQSRSRRLEDLLSEDDVVSALATGDGLRVVLQPQYDLSSRRVVGAEALVCWEHALHGEVPLSVLIPMVKNFELDLLLFSYVEMAVIEVLCKLNRLDIEMPIAINASARALCAAGLASRLAAKMHKAGLATSRLKIELTDKVTSDNELEISAAIMALRAKGFLISLDDFAAGAATSAMLAGISFDELKIDGRLVQALERTPQSDDIISGIVSMAQFFNLSLVVDGIEESSSIDVLKRLGCSTGQGFALAHPLEQEDFFSLVAP